MRRVAASLLAWFASAALLVACGAASPKPPVPPVRPRPAAPLVVALPGACVDPAKDAVSRLGPDADSASLRTEDEIDLDADGAPDRLVTHPNFCGTGGCNWQLYVSRGGCSHFVGELFGLLPTLREGVTAGLFDLQITARNGCGGMARTETRSRFNGQAYVDSEVRNCRCPEPAEEVNEDTDPDRWCEPWRPARE